MGDFLTNDTQIQAVLDELAEGVSEADSVVRNDNENGSEIEDNVEVESHYSTEYDDTDKDPDFIPSDCEERGVRRPILTNLDLTLQASYSSADLVPNLEPPNENLEPPNDPVIIPLENIMRSPMSSRSTIMTIDVDSLEQVEDPKYLPSSGDSSSDECREMDIDVEEENSLIGSCSAQACTDASGQIMYLSSLKNHKNIILPKLRILRGKNGYIWASKPSCRSNRVPKRNIIHFRQRPINNAANVENITDCFKLFITPSIIDTIVSNTNEEIAHKKDSYSQDKSATVQPTNSIEINALLGLLVLTAAMKDNHLTSKELFDPTFSGTRYVSVMSRDRFDFLLNCLRFDDKNTHSDRRKEDKFAAIRDIWDQFIESCRNNYCPGSYVTIDEQLLGFRGRCPFRMYLPSKPNKYGIKLFMLCDVKTKYLIDACPYLGKDCNTSGLPLGAFFTKKLTKTIHGTNRNVTMDNWFTSVPLAKDMLESHKLTIVGTMRGDKAEIPPQMKESKSRKINSVMFGYNNNLILASYKAKRNKMVYMLSTTHETGTVSETSGKPDIVEFYNSTKGAVDAFDEMSSNMSCSRKTQRWPLCIFYGLINSSLINSYIVYVHNMVSQRKKPLCRRDFAKRICEELTEPHLQARLQVRGLHKNLKYKIEEILGEKAQINEPQPEEAVGRKICAFCPSRKRRMTRFKCFSCKRFYCQEHKANMCVDCS